MPSDTHQVPCPACNWTPEQQSQCNYKSNVHLFYSAGDRGAWSLGSKFILKDRGSSPPNYESANTKFVKDNTTIPIPEIVQEWSENRRNMLIVERVPGEPLQEAWPNMKLSEKEALAEETAEYLSQLRQLHASKMQSVHGQPLYNAFLFSGKYGMPHGPLMSEDELFDAIAVEFKDTPDEVTMLTRLGMPSPFPWTFTHGDITYCNIMVDLETYRLTGIIDWEGSGYYPVWWEYVGAIGLSTEDAEWKALLRKYMPDYSAALEWYKDVYACRDSRGMRKERWETLMRDAGLS